MNEIHEELRLHNGSALRLNWLRDKLVLKSTSLPEECIHFVVRGFLLFVLGCTLFCDKTGSSVSVSYLKYLGDMEDIASVGWGAATLAHLYRQLGIASRAKCRQISGFLTLLEVSSFTPPCLVDPFA
ncbi:hypothetical protein QJS04_geneDACA022846 [Acorus gramineus]|uniref:Aminotransferase-like plant mobile domain-containing protein n=1 Tax=Acorus gramineus TaxID=55184 RepID=A0AAV9A4F9_ACOGR|nr:hypothetical protein QJS04_geneDACA005482 [Acorus gramineus]KAK1269000.1 hypothetical protein QJS04_geneDACA022846 [Acorus gramineus]